jgi:hypothetical protein
MTASRISSSKVLAGSTTAEPTKAVLTRLRVKFWTMNSSVTIGLVTDGRRLEVIQTSSRFLDRDEYAALLEAIQAALAH